MTAPVRSLIVYSSPAGSTRHVARVIEKRLISLGSDVGSLDLGKIRETGPFTEPLNDPGVRTCLYIGSPVFGMHAVPPVTDFILGLPETRTGYAVPFVTWGGSCSGIALYEMGSLLQDKGFRILGAAKVPAVLSMLWFCDHPRGEGHPDSRDDQAVADLAEQVMKNAGSVSPRGLPLSDLAYQPERLHRELVNTPFYEATTRFAKRQFYEGNCTACGTCAEACPADAITLSPYPEFGDQCFSCFNCVRVCPEGAIHADLSMQEEKIRKRAEQVGEPHEPALFIGSGNAQGSCFAPEIQE